MVSKCREWMDTPILCIYVCATINIMLKLNTNNDANVQCEQAFRSSPVTSLFSVLGVNKHLEAHL